jgi:excinuclease UvrABC nuclease subunit
VVVKMDKIEDLVDVKVSYKPNICGIYKLYSGGVCVYVGQSKCIRNRVSSHIYNGKVRFDAVDYLECDESELSVIEATEIIKLKPKYNKTIPSSYAYMSRAQFCASVSKFIAEKVDGEIDSVFVCGVSRAGEWIEPPNNDVLISWIKDFKLA